MVASKPEAFPVLLVCSWNVKQPNVHREMLATREMCLAETVGDLLAVALLASLSMWSLRYSFGEVLGSAFSAGCNADVRARLEAGAGPNASQVHAGHGLHLL